MIILTKRFLSFILSIWYINQFGQANAALNVPSTELSLLYSCIYALNDYTFDTNSTSASSYSSYNKFKCSSRSWLASMDNCLMENSQDNSDTYQYSITYLTEQCPEYSASSADESKATVLITNSVSVSYYMKTFEDLRDDIRLCQNLGWGLIAFWGFIVTVASIYHLNKKFIGLSINRNNKLTKFIQKFIILPALFKKRSEKSLTLFKFFSINIPKRLNFITLFLFLIQLIFSSCFNYPLTSDSNFSSSYFLLLDLISYRTSIFAIYLLPMVFFFGVRNNPFAIISGISQSTFILFHKVLSILMFILCTIHAIIWTVYAEKSLSYASYYNAEYWKWGITACTTTGLLIFFSLKFFRSIMYELFLILHQILIALFIVALHFHTSIFGWHGWVYMIIAIVAFDRAMRIFRIIAFGGFYQNAIISRHGHSDTKNEVLKIQINKPWLMPYFPGSYVFVSFALPWYKIWQSHPFTIISYSDSESDSKYLVMYIKARKGITRSVFNIPESKWDENDTIRTRIIIDGPYGISTYSKNDDSRTLVGVSAGMGFTAVLPGFINAIKNKKDLIANVSSKSRFMGSFYWIINDLSYLSWANEHLNYLVENNFSVTVYYTGTKGIQDQSESYSPIPKSIASTPGTTSLTNSSLITKMGIESGSDISVSGIKELRQMLNLPVNNLYAIDISIARPDLVALVGSEMLVQDNKKLKFITCGSDSFNDDIRYAVLKNIDLNDPEQDIEFSSESFVW